MSLSHENRRSDRRKLDDQLSDVSPVSGRVKKKMDGTDGKFHAIFFILQIDMEKPSRYLNRRHSPYIPM